MKIIRINDNLSPYQLAPTQTFLFPWVTTLLLLVVLFPPAIWAQHQEEPQDNCFLLRLTNGQTAVWLADLQLGLTPAWPGEPAPNLQATFVSHQKLTTDTKTDIRAWKDSLQMTTAIMRTYPHPTGKQFLYTLEFLFNDLEWKGHLDAEKKLRLFTSKKLSAHDWESHAPLMPNHSGTTAVGYPRDVEHHQPHARKAFFWLTEYPFWYQTLDSLGAAPHPIPNPPSLRISLADPLYDAFRESWPLRRSQMLLDLFRSDGHPLIRMVELLEQQQTRRVKTGQGPDPAQTREVITLALALAREPQLEKLGRQMAFYFRHVHGQALPSWLVQQVSLFHKDYLALANAFSAKSMLLKPDWWVAQYREDPAAILDRLTMDYGYMVLAQMLTNTSKAVHSAIRPLMDKQKQHMMTYWSTQVPEQALLISGGRYALPIDIDSRSKALRKASFAPGMNGALVTDQQGRPVGILIQCREDALAGQWEPERPAACSFIYPWADVRNAVQNLSGRR